MNRIETVHRMWNDIGEQRWSELTKYFEENAVIEWPNTKEQFTPLKWKTVNECYPGNWKTEIKSCINSSDITITVTLIQNTENDQSIYAVSFFRFNENRIVHLTEYFSENTPPPAWRNTLEI